MCASDKTGTATGTLLVENEHVKVWEWRFRARGENTGWHRHEYPYVVIPLFDGVLDIDTGACGRMQGQMRNGVPYFRDAGVEHDVINANDFECAFIEVEALR